MRTSDVQIANQPTEVLTIGPEVSEKSCKQIKIAPPRPAWLVFSLMFGSCGLYPITWLFYRTREFKFILKNSLKPWLWIFVPLAALPQLFALPRFVKDLNKIELEANLPTWNAWHGAWYALVIILTIIFNLTDKIELPRWSFFPFLVLWSLLFTVIDQRIAQAKKVLTQYEYKKYKYRISKIECLTLLIALPFTLFLTYTLVAPDINTIQKLSDSSIYTNTKNKFTLPILENGWVIVKNGTHSNGDAILELHGPLHDMYFIAFQYARDESINSIMTSRLNAIIDNLSNANCNQTREFSRNAETVIAKAFCTGTFVNEKVIDTATIIETKEGFFELYGHMSSTAKSYAEHEKNFKAMAAGFSPL